MVRRYMTERQNEQQRLQNKMSRYDHRLISSVFPTVVKIVIEYEVEHRSAFGESREKHVSTHTPDMIATFLPVGIISGVFAEVLSPTYLSKAPIAMASPLIPNTQFPSHWRS